VVRQNIMMEKAWLLGLWQPGSGGRERERQRERMKRMNKEEEERRMKGPRTRYNC
jgi:hypothetical protein